MFISQLSSFILYSNTILYNVAGDPTTIICTYMQNEKKERGREVRQRKRKNCTQCGVPSRIIPRKVKPSG